MATKNTARSNPLAKQVGGTHYQTKGVQHTTFCQRNRVPWNESAAIKYILRHRRKNGKQDLEKAIHYMEFICHEEYLVRGDVGLGNPTDMDPDNFHIPLRIFLRDNEVPGKEADVIKTLLYHQMRRGESTVIDAINKTKALLKEYDEEDFSHLL